MSTEVSPASERVWTVIEREKRRDRLVRRVSIAAWSVTGGALLFFAAVTGVEVWLILQHVAEGVAPWAVVFDRVIPLVAVVGVLGLLVAILSTVGIFLRLRTASLSEIQLRLAALEEMIASHLELHED
ncbi:MAG: hypothetical protein JSW71_23620 [Gemmatimonadota bacterium]|nr:MAG: hypothetical protein JSW71_23620 [Gemmatimonadota bacterium]